MVVDGTGPHLLYTCDQRTVDNAWTGMVTPAATTQLSPHLHDAAICIGTWLDERGYRGVYDVDCGVTSTGFVVTEANVRRTGGTYLHELAERLMPELTARHWRADARAGGRAMTFADAVRALDAAAIDEPGGTVRVVLTADTFAEDGRWRYLVVGADAESVESAEVALLEVLGVQ